MLHVLRVFSLRFRRRSGVDTPHNMVSSDHARDQPMSLQFCHARGTVHFSSSCFHRLILVSQRKSFSTYCTLHFLCRCLGIVREAASWGFPSLFWGPPTLDALDESPLNTTVTIGSSVGDEWLDGLNDLPLSRDDIERKRTGMTPQLWDSRRCMEFHGTPELQTEVDPGGYLIFRDGR